MVDDGAAPRTWAQQSQWAMVLAACGIPFMQSRRGQRAVFYVPPLLEQRARLELADFSREGYALPPSPVLVHKAGAWPALLPLALLIWHGLRMGWWDWAQGWTTPPALWSTLGALDTLRVAVYHEWYRCATALTLHADSTHLLGNVAFGALFVSMLCRAQGPGLGVLLTVLGGILGNVCNVLLRPEPLVSLGFSTALFAAVGGLSGSRMVQSGKKALLPLAAGLALLALLGTEGQRTDYVAHVSGLGAGVFLGLGVQSLRTRWGMPDWVQWVAGFIALFLLVASWVLAGLRW